jgi:hypothetical protein
MLKRYLYDGVDLDVEEYYDLNSIRYLIYRLKQDFGSEFLISLAPVLPALQYSLSMYGIGNPRIAKITLINNNTSNPFELYEYDTDTELGTTELGEDFRESLFGKRYLTNQHSSPKHHEPSNKHAHEHDAGSITHLAPNDFDSSHMQDIMGSDGGLFPIEKRFHYDKTLKEEPVFRNQRLIEAFNQTSSPNLDVCLRRWNSWDVEKFWHDEQGLKENSSKNGVHRRNLSGFDYFALSASPEGDLVDWYNVQMYCGWGNPLDLESIDLIAKRGWDMNKIVMATLTAPAHGSGFANPLSLGLVLQRHIEKFPNFGGVTGWEYFNPSGHHSAWATVMECFLNGGSQTECGSGNTGPVKDELANI